jgi:hypothetical protein
VLTDVNPLIIIIITQQTENAYPSIEWHWWTRMKRRQWERDSNHGWVGCMWLPIESSTKLGWPYLLCYAWRRKGEEWERGRDKQWE